MQITDKQVKFLGNLLSKSEFKLSCEPGQLTKYEASRVIDFLVKYKDNKETQMTDDIKKFFVGVEDTHQNETLLPGNLFPVDEDETLPF